MSENETTAVETTKAKRNRKPKQDFLIPEGGFTSAVVDGFRYRETRQPQPSDFSDCVSNVSSLYCQFMKGQYVEQVVAYYTKLEAEMAGLTPEQRKEMAESKRQLTLAKKAAASLGAQAISAGIDSLQNVSREDIEALMQKLAAQLAATN